MTKQAYISPKEQSSDTPHQKPAGPENAESREYREEELLFRLAEKDERIGMLEGAVNASWVGFVLSDGQGNALMTNPSHHRISGLDPANVIGRNYSAMEQEQNNRSCTMEVIRQGQPVKLEQELHSGRKYMVYGAPYTNPKSGRQYIVCNLVDDIEVNRIKQELEIAGNNTRESELLSSQPLKSTDISKYIVHKSSKMQSVLKTCSKIAPFDSTVMLLGDSGTGKELLADYVVSQSKRSKNPYIKVNCAAIPDTLLEAELFGYEAGSFTNASVKGKRGIFEIAHNGTVMLDEIGELPLNLQSKLLRFLQEKEIFHIGGLYPIKVDVRVIAATNRDLEKLVQEKKFRSDLYYRLNVIPIKVPPLRHRREDIPILIRHFLKKFNEKYDLKRQISYDIIEYFKYKDLEGNVRELQNYIERIVLLAPKDVISLEDIVELIEVKEHVEDAPEEYGSLRLIMDECEKSVLKSCLNRYDTITQASAALGISQPTLSRKLAYHNLNPMKSEQE